MNSSESAHHWAAFALRDPASTVGHKAYNEAMAKLKRIMATQDDTWLAQVVASTGAGKTHMATVLHGQFLNEYAEEMKSDRTFQPSVYVSMRLLGDSTKHNWSDDYSKILKALNHPSPRSRDLSEARDKITKALSARRTARLILDEAGHFISGCDPNDTEALKRRANVVKSLTDDTQTRLVLFSTYDLLPMVRINGQLARRNQLVHLQRYRNTQGDRAQFREILGKLENALPVHLQVSLVQLEEYIYRGCLGLIGTLRNWLVRASVSAEQRGRRGIDKDDLEATKETLGALTPMLEEALNGEARLTETLQDQANFDDLLKQDRLAATDSLDGTGDEESQDALMNDSPEVPPREPQKKRRRRPGRPNPTRRPTGNTDEGET